MKIKTRTNRIKFLYKRSSIKDYKGLTCAAYIQYRRVIVNMNPQDITQIITNLGFPIVCCLALGYFVWQFANKLNNDSTSRENRLMDYFDKQNTILTTMSNNMEKMSTTLDDINQRLVAVEGKVEDKVHS